MRSGQRAVRRGQDAQRAVRREREAQRAVRREREAQRAAVEGRQAVRELLRARRRAVIELVVAEHADQRGALAEILELAETAAVPVRRVARSRLEALATTDAPQGVVAFADPLPEHDLASLLTPRGELRAPADATAPFLVVLDGVTDPHNLGAVMRSALCAGATGLVVGRHRSASIGAAATKAAAGAAEWLPVAVVAGIPAALGELRQAGVWTVGLAANADTAIWDVDLGREPLALVLGAEGTGLSSLVRRRCDVLAGIPLQGPITSLNVSAAAALTCFEIARRRARS